MASIIAMVVFGFCSTNRSMAGTLARTHTHTSLLAAPKGMQVETSPGPQTSELGSRSDISKYTSELFKGAAGMGKTDPYVSERGQESHIH